MVQKNIQLWHLRISCLDPIRRQRCYRNWATDSRADGLIGHGIVQQAAQNGADSSDSKCIAHAGASLRERR